MTEPYKVQFLSDQDHEQLVAKIYVEGKSDVEGKGALWQSLNIREGPEIRQEAR